MPYAITYRENRVSIKSGKLVILLVLIFFGNHIFAQNNDSILTKKHSPRKATIMSACLPGLGQAYNKKYWKIPIIYGGAAAVAYSVSFNNHYYKIIKQAYQYRTDTDTSTIDNYPYYSTDGLLTLKNYYRRNLELSFILGGVLYALNILDATVDAHLFNFDIKDDLSMRINPILMTSQNHSFAGLSFSFTFGKNMEHR
jgi:hypothetical protein